MHNDDYRLVYESKNNSRRSPAINRSTPTNDRNVLLFNWNNGRQNTNNVNFCTEEANFAFFYGYIDDLKIECLLDTGYNRTKWKCMGKVKNEDQYRTR